MTIMPAGRIRRVHVDQARIRANIKAEPSDRLPPLTVQTSNGPVKADEVIIRDATGNIVARFVYSPDKPLSCGARLWVTTTCEIELITHAT